MSNKRKAPSCQQQNQAQSGKNRPPPRTCIDNDDIRFVASPYASSSPGGGILTPVTSTEMKHILFERLEKEIISKFGGRICRRGTNNSGSNANDRDGKKLSKKSRRRVQKGEAKIICPQPVAKIDAKQEKILDNNEIESHFANNKKSPLGIPELIIRRRFIVGINQCTKILENAVHQHQKQQPLLVKGMVNPKVKRSPIPSLILISRDVRPATILAHIPIYAELLNIPTVILPGKASSELGKVAGIRSVAVAMFLPSFELENLPDEIQTGLRGVRVKEWKECQDDVDSFVKFVKSKILK